MTQEPTYWWGSLLAGNILAEAFREGFHAPAGSWIDIFNHELIDARCRLVEGCFSFYTPSKAEETATEKAMHNSFMIPIKQG